tara:strand:+ start:293 stop:535 length:243 start_codon:yes stop_codon:yes gene_type:complete
MKIIYTILVAGSFLISSSSFACPYQAMAEIDQKLNSKSLELSSEKISQITDLRIKGESFLKTGDLTKSEEILNNALALFK